jgi:hypothetical protein
MALRFRSQTLRHIADGDGRARRLKWLAAGSGKLACYGCEVEEVLRQWT